MLDAHAYFTVSHMDVERRQRSSGHALVFTLAVDPGEPLSGLIALDGAAGETKFSGWVELMAAIDAARARATAAADSPGAEGRSPEA